MSLTECFTYDSIETFHGKMISLFIVLLYPGSDRFLLQLEFDRTKVPVLIETVFYFMYNQALYFGYIRLIFRVQIQTGSFAVML